MKTTIKHIASIQTGFFAKPNAKGDDVYYFQLQDFEENGQQHEFMHPALNINKIPNQHFLQTGDVLFAAKSAKNFAAVIGSDFTPAVASTSFFVIRLKTENVLPEFLAYFLNSSSTLNILKNLARGTSIPSIRKSDLENIEITIPSIEIQHKIIKLQELSNREASIRMEILEKQKEIIEQKIINAIKSIDDNENNSKRH